MFLLVFSPSSEYDLLSRLEQFDRIAVRIFQLDLFSAWTYFHLIAKMEPCLLQRLNLSRKIGHLKNYTVPAAGLLTAAIRHRART